MSTDPGRQIDGEKTMAEIFAQLDELCELRGFTHHRLALKLSGVSKTAGGRSEKKC